MQKTAIAWAPRERVVADLTARRDREQDPRRRAVFENAVAALSATRKPGTVSLVVSGWGDLGCTSRTRGTNTGLGPSGGTVASNRS